MLKNEFKKMLIKHFGALIALIVIIGEIIILAFSYRPEQFTSEVSERCYNEYMERFSGQLTPEKEEEILAEQLQIVDAKNVRSEIELNLLYGKYTSESEYISDYENACAIVERKEAFDVLFEKYSYSLDDPEKRFMTIGDYSGLTQDLPDIFLLFAVIFLTATLFLNEEQSNVITFIRISPGGQQKTLRGKLAAVFSFTFVCHLFRTLAELFAMILSGNSGELSYPVQSIEFFANCPYDISILQAFITISALRLLGYFFIEAVVILLAATVRKALPTIFVPCAVCLLQQFAFDPATPAYYIPTGFLRAVGYFRGSVYKTNYMGEKIAVFSEIPFSYLVLLVVFTIIFIAASLIAAYSYYSCKPIKLPAKAASLLAVLIIGGTFSGCSADPKTQTQSVVYNLSENEFFAQNDTEYFVSNNAGIMRISKSDGTETYLPNDEFDSDRRKKLISLYGNTLYQSIFFNGGDITALSLDNFSEYKIKGLSNQISKNGFLEIKAKLSRKSFVIDLTATGLFTNGSDYFIVSDTSVYQIKNGRAVCVIDGEVFFDKLCFDGKRIYYIDGLLHVNCLDISSGEKTRLGGDIASAIYFDGTRLLYSDKSGIYSLDTNDFSTEKLSEKTADKISSDGKNIVYSSGGALYLLSDDEIRLTDNVPVSYAVVSGLNKVLTVSNEADDVFDLIEIPSD